MKKVSIILLCILSRFIQLHSVITHAHGFFIQNMAEQSAESYVSLYGNGKAISFLQNVKKVRVVLNQRTNGPVNAHLISWPSKAQNIQNLENIW